MAKKPTPKKPSTRIKGDPNPPPTKPPITP